MMSSKNVSDGAWVFILHGTTSVGSTALSWSSPGSSSTERKNNCAPSLCADRCRDHSRASVDEIEFVTKYRANSTCLMA